MGDADLGDVARKACLLLEPEELHHGKRRHLVGPAFDAIRVVKIAIGAGEPVEGGGGGLRVHSMSSCLRLSVSLRASGSPITLFLVRPSGASSGAFTQCDHVKFGALPQRQS